VLLVQEPPYLAVHTFACWLVDEFEYFVSNQIGVGTPASSVTRLFTVRSVPSRETAQAASSNESISSLKLRCERMMT